MGTISLGILYVSFAIFSLVASLVVKKLGSKNALILGTTGYWLFIAANLKPSWYISDSEMVDFLEFVLDYQMLVISCFMLLCHVLQHV